MVAVDRPPLKSPQLRNHITGQKKKKHNGNLRRSQNVLLFVINKNDRAEISFVNYTF